MSGEGMIIHAHLPGLLSVGQVLVLHSSLSLLLCLMCEQGVLRLQCVEPLTVEEGRALVPLPQAFPAYASYALVRASIQYSTIEEAHDQLNTAWLQGEVAWVAFMQPLRTVLGNFRRKLHACHIDIVAVQRRGYLLKHWKEQR